MEATRASNLPIAHSERQASWKLPPSASVFMNDDGSFQTPPPSRGLDAHEDARALVRLVQCTVCSRPFRVPVTLPCGHSTCRSCLPEPHRRENISYPDTPDRQQGVKCPIESCGQVHPLGECNINVCLSKIMDTIRDVTRSFQFPGSTTTKIQEIWTEASLPPLPLALEKQPSKTFKGGRLLSTYEFAESGELAFQHDCSYESESQSVDDCRRLDKELLAAIKENTARELDCHVCYSLIFDPVTTPCGHTFCRKCLARVLDHAIQCPICRRTLPMPPSLERQASNVRLVSLLLGLCPDLVQLRAEAVATDERGVAGQLNTPIFVCTLAFPSLPTYLHIFEPRYRLMIRRAMEGNRRFGMVMYNHNPREAQSGLGLVSFLEYGTVLEIINVRMLADGRSLIETRGCDRFRIKAHGMLDGYLVGCVERVEDVSLAEEERLEAEETSSVTTLGSPMEELLIASEVAEAQQLSTQQLFDTSLDFINKMQANSAPWLHQRIIDAYGDPPNDPALFPYWFASILPIAEEEKYQLLKTTTVRERLKIVFVWIKRIERQRWQSGGVCSIL